MASSTLDRHVRSATEEIDRALRFLAPPTVRARSRRIDGADWEALHESEQQLVAAAVAKRRHEFATGRVLLRHVLGYEGPIGIEPSRAPSWPAGTRGSLAHDRHVAVAAVTRDPSIIAIGIDVEPTALLSPEMAEVILRPEERSLDAHLAFALKEATYKAWSALGGRMLDHHDVLVAAQDGRFRALVVKDGVPFDGAYVTIDERMVALVVVTA